MERKGVPLNLISLKMLQDRKSVRQSEFSGLLSSPRADRIKRSISPAFVDLQRISMRHKVLSPRASRPFTSPKKLSALTIPRSRQELVAQYTRQSFDIDSIMRHKSPKLSSYKKDAASLLTSSLKKHYNKFFYIWRKHAKDLKKELIRREALRPSRSAFLTPPLPKSPARQRSEADSQFSYTYSETSPDYRRRAGLLSPTSVESEAVYVRLKVADRHLADVSTLVRKDLPPRAVTGFSADLYSEEQRVASSNISRRDVVTETSPVMSPVSDVTGNVIKLIFTLAMLLQRRKQQGLLSLKLGLRKIEAARRLYGTVYRRAMVRMQGFIYTLMLGRPTFPRTDALPLVKSLQKAILRPVWETLRLETIKSMIAQLFQLSVQRLSALYLSRLSHAFQCLQASPYSPLPRKPAITLKTILHIVLMHRLQVAFNTTRRFGESAQRRMVDARTKLRRCFQVCEVAKVKLLAKYFNRLRKGPGLREARQRGRNGAVVGAKVAAQILEQGRKRRMREAVASIALYTSYKELRQRQFVAISGLFQAISSKTAQNQGELFETFRTIKRLDRIVRKGKRVLTRMIRMYCKDSAVLLRSAYQTWKQLKILTNPVLSAPEISMFALIMQGLLRRRVESGFERLKARLFGVEEENGEKKAAAMAVSLAIGFALKSRLEIGLSVLQRDEQVSLSSGAYIKGISTTYPGARVTASHQGKAKLVAVKLVSNWIAEVEKKEVALCFRQLRRPLTVARGVNLLQKAQKHVSLRLWRKACSLQKQLTRGAELLQLRLSSKFRSYFQSFYPDDSGSSFLDMYAHAEVAPKQALSLRFCLEKLRTNHAMAEMTVLERWRSLDLRRQEWALQRRTGVLEGVVRLVHAVRAKTVLLENAAFQSLLIG